MCKEQKMSTETPFYNVPLPIPPTSYAQAKLGMLELDADNNGTALVSHGDIELDGAIMNTSNTSKVWFDYANTFNVSATNLVMNSGIVFSNVSQTSTLGINYSATVPSSSVSWYKSGGVYLTSVSSTDGAHALRVLAVMP